MRSAATLVLVMLAMSASAAVDARALVHEGQKTQWAPTRNFSSLNARAVFAGESRGATSPYAGEEWETAAGEKDWQYAAGNPTRFVDLDGREGGPLMGAERRHFEGLRRVTQDAAAGDPVAKRIQQTAFFGTGAMASPLLLGCATPAGAPVCQALGMVALGGVFTSGQPTLTGIEQQVNACVSPQSPMDSMSCGVGVGATAIGAGSLVSRLAPQGRAAVASMMLESSEMSLPATMARGAPLEPAPLISVAEQAAAPAARVAPTPSLADLKPLYSGTFSAVSSQPSMSWSNGAARAQVNAATPNVVSLRVVNPHFEVKIGKSLEAFHPDSMIHITPEEPSVFAEGVRAWEYWARLGDVAALTPTEYRIAVVGPAAAGWSPKANKFLVVPPGSGAVFMKGTPSAFGYPEYQNTAVVRPTSVVEVQTGPSTDVYRSLPYPPEFTPAR